MKLKDLIRGKKADDSFATATHATVATNEGKEEAAVAKVATVSVANPWKDETEESQISRHERVEKMLMADPGRKYAVLVEGADTDPVTVTVGIRRIAIFDMAIPKTHYDAFALMDVLEQYSVE